MAAENNSNRNTSLMMCDTVKSDTVGCRYRESEHTDNDILYDFLMFAVFTVACATYLIVFFINELKVISWGSVSHRRPPTLPERISSSESRRSTEFN